MLYLITLTARNSASGRLKDSIRGTRAMLRHDLAKSIDLELLMTEISISDGVWVGARRRKYDEEHGMTSDNR